ncbi:MAG: FecR family protein [Sphingobacteriales bacterium]|nr:MAG: FecR family protein [Sphingobacteriales bacterium]
MDTQEVKDLLKRYDQGQCTEQEIAWIETWYLNQPAETIINSVEELAADLDEVEGKLIEYITVKRITLWPRIAAAASILFAKDGNHLITKTNDGAVVYIADGTVAKEKLVYNTITTPRGGQWPLTLPDGTKVMLDAASSIKYPIAFTHNERKVEITGQVYFEVVHNAAKPFRVIAKGQVIEDIGTIFNVNAYDDEPAFKTTLVEGAVKVAYPNAAAGADREGILLKPGQQTSLYNSKLTVSNANVENVLAWRNGYFNFKDEKLESVMRKLSRWYNIEVEYKGDLPDKLFEGEIPRNINLSQVLKVLQVANIHFTVDGKRIIVTP